MIGEGSGKLFHFECKLAVYIIYVIERNYYLKLITKEGD